MSRVMRAKLVRATAPSAPLSPEHPTFIEKFALAIAGPDSAKSQWIARAIAPNLVARRMGQPPKSDLRIMFRAFLTKNGCGEVRVRPKGRSFQLGYGDALWSYVLHARKDGELGDELRADLETRLRAATANMPQESNDDFLAVEATVKRCAHKFSSYLPYLHAVSFGETIEAEIAMLESLTIIGKECANFGVNMNLDPVHLGMAGLWDETA
jgi:hypothetical protein